MATNATSTCSVCSGLYLTRIEEQFHEAHQRPLQDSFGSFLAAKGNQVYANVYETFFTPVLKVGVEDMAVAVAVAVAGVGVGLPLCSGFSEGKTDFPFSHTNQMLLWRPASPRANTSEPEGRAYSSPQQRMHSPRSSLVGHSLGTDHTVTPPPQSDSGNSQL